MAVPRKEIAIADIKTVSIIADKVDNDGFVKARLVQADGSEVDSAKVLVQDMLGGVKLKGYTKVGTEYSIELADCRVVEFSCSVEKGRSATTRPEDVEYKNIGGGKYYEKREMLGLGHK